MERFKAALQQLTVKEREAPKPIPTSLLLEGDDNNVASKLLAILCYSVWCWHQGTCLKQRHLQCCGLKWHSRFIALFA